MFVRDAKALCPHLVIFPYDFKSYEEVSGWLSTGLSIILLMEDGNHILFLKSPYKGVLLAFDILGNMQVADQFYDILHKHCDKVQVCFR